MALAAHLEEAELADLEHVRAGAVAAQRLLEGAVHLLLVLAALHVDEVEHDEPADVAEAQLARHLVDGLEVDFEDGVLLRSLALVVAGVHVDGDEGLGLVDHEVAAGLQAHFRRTWRLKASRSCFSMPRCSNTLTGPS